MASFVCNLCGAENSYSGQPFEREKPSCSGCGSSVRTRGLVGALSIELFGIGCFILLCVNHYILIIF